MSRIFRKRVKLDMQETESKEKIFEKYDILSFMSHTNKILFSYSRAVNQTKSGKNIVLNRWLFSQKYL